MRKRKILLSVVIMAMSVMSIFCINNSAHALTYVEDFEAPFPAWESGWLGTNTNLENYYVVHSGIPNTYRGNNPDGLWLDDGDGAYSNDVADIVFNSTFGASLTGLSIDIAGNVPVQFRVYDMSNVLLLDVNVVLTYGALTDPGVYSNYSVASTNGISGMSFIQNGISQVEGNTSIDNVVAYAESVPEPSMMLLLGSSLIGLVAFRKKFKKK